MSTSILHFGTLLSHPQFKTTTWTDQIVQQTFYPLRCLFQRNNLLYLVFSPWTVVRVDQVRILSKELNDEKLIKLPIIIQDTGSSRLLCISHIYCTLFLGIVSRNLWQAIELSHSYRIDNHQRVKKVQHLFKTRFIEFDAVLYEIAWRRL